MVCLKVLKAYFEAPRKTDESIWNEAEAEEVRQH
jgi:hypothetical protein